MLKRSKLLFILLFFCTFDIYSQEEQAKNTDELFDYDSLLEEEENDQEEAVSLESVNLDMQVVYGQYNNLLSTVNYSQEEDDFVYFLRSDYKRSNDYGYQGNTFQNSGYFENSLDFSGNFSVDNSFTSIFQAGVENESRGMHDKPDYSREEKEKVQLSSKNIKKFSSSFEAYLSTNGAFYKHRLEERDDALEEVENSLTRYTVETGGELIWSSSNRIRYKSLFTHYSYTGDAIPYDRYVQGELVDDFKISDFLGFGIGVNGAWNRDNGLFTWDAYNMPLPVMPILGLTIFGNQYYTIYFNYRYDLQPFRPEEYYYAQHFIYPTYDLDPSKVHTLDGRLDLAFGDRLLIKNMITFKESDNYYNYMPSDVSEYLITAHGVKAKILTYAFDEDISIIRNQLRIIGGYQYQRFFADENITYAPLHSLNMVAKFNGKIINIDWTNELISPVFIDPDSDEKLKEALVGYLDVQFKTIETFYAYLRLENLYNNEYYLRDGYPEAGLTALIGIRILI